MKPLVHYDFVGDGQYADNLQVQDLTITPTSRPVQVYVHFSDVNVVSIGALLAFVFALTLLSGGLRMPANTKVERSRRLDALVPALLTAAISTIVFAVAWGEAIR